MSDPLARLKELAKKLPDDAYLKADWNGTNHYEMTLEKPDSHESSEYWWLTLFDYNPFQNNLQGTEPGKRIGLMMDIMEEVSRLKHAGHL